MNTILKLITLITIVTVNLACSQKANTAEDTVALQRADTVLQKMVNLQLLTSKEAQEFEARINQQRPRLNTYIEILLEVQRQQDPNFDSRIFELWRLNKRFPEDEQKQVSKTLPDYLLKLKTCGLIDEKLYQQELVKINHDQFVHVMRLLSDILEQRAVNAKMSPARLKLSAKKMYDKSIITTKYQDLLRDIELGRVDHQFDFLNYVDHAVFINVKNVSEEKQLLEEVHRKTASMFPVLNFTDFTSKVFSRNSPHGYQAYYCLAGLKSNGRQYLHESFSNPTAREVDFKDGYYDIFNKLLIDLQSPYRIREATGYFYSEGSVENGQEGFWVIALTKEQANLLVADKNDYDERKEPDDLIESAEDQYWSPLPSIQIEQAIEGYQAIGLFKHLTSTEIANAKERVAANINTNITNVLSTFPQIIYPISPLSYEGAGKDNDDRYAELVKQLSILTHHEFNPANVSYSFKYGEYEPYRFLKLTFNNKDYEQEFYPIPDAGHSTWTYLDTEFLHFINKVIRENNLRGQFYFLSGRIYLHSSEDKNERTGLIYLTPKQYNYLRTNKLLSFYEASPGKRK